MTTKPKLILLVDDSDDDNYFHQRAIRSSGYDCKIDVCTSGDIAMDYLTNQGEYQSRGTEYPAPDLIFLDINMPRVNGWEFLDLYAQWAERADAVVPEPSSIIIVMLSTSLNPADKERAAASRFVKDYLSKPLTPDAFVEVVKAHLSDKFDK